MGPKFLLEWASDNMGEDKMVIIAQINVFKSFSLKGFKKITVFIVGDVVKRTFITESGFFPPVVVRNA